MASPKPFGDFEIFCDHAIDWGQGLSVAEIANSNFLIAEKNDGTGTRQVGTSRVIPNTTSGVVQLTCPMCPMDVQLTPKKLKMFVESCLAGSKREANLRLVQLWATRL